MLTVLPGLAQYGCDGDNGAVVRAVQDQVTALTSKIPIYK